MKIKMTANTWLMGKLYKMGFEYEVNSEVQSYLKNKSETVEIKEVSKPVKNKK